ncbi:MAG: hypothetical protein J6J43_04750 [Oscillospiraceae bacterium]|nr:hypothetical protein [Oscillospiraceae bacterium]
MYHIHTKDIRIRDPFIVPCKERQVYYLFGTTDTDPWHGAGEGFLVYESKDLELWSSFSKDDYVLGVVKSKNGKLIGPWTHEETPRFSFGGHGMLFEDLQGKTWLALHSPNTDQLERLTLIPFEK